MTYSFQDFEFLHAAEDSIKRDWKNAAANLAKVKESGLYRAYAATVEEWCELRLGWSRQRLYQVLDASEVVAALPPSLGDHVVSTKAAEELKKSHPEDRALIVQGIVEKGEPVTAKAVKEAEKEIRAEVAQIEAKDFTGHVIPKHHLTFFKRGEKVRDLLQKISDVRKVVRAMENVQGDLIFATVNTQDVLAHLGSAYDQIKCAIPFAVCPYCQGQKSEGCQSCKGRAFLSEFAWKTVVPEELKIGRGGSQPKAA